MIPIADLLGPEGHDHCTGWQLKPVDGSMETASRKAKRLGRGEGGGARAGPFLSREAAPVPTFQGGAIIFAFTRNRERETL